MMIPANKVSKIAAVVVTHNRLELLKECISALRDQTRRPDEIIVIDNASTDGTHEWLTMQSDLTVIKQGNLGSAGGQYTGIKTAYQHRHDWIWCMDDDSKPGRQALEALTKCPFFGKDSTGFLASLVVWKDGSAHTMNLTNPTHVREWIARVLEDRCLKIRGASFVGVMISRIAVAKLGFPIKEFFIWGDDVEYTLRISRQFPCYIVLDSCVIHQTEKNLDADEQISPADNRSLKIKCRYRNFVTIILFERASLLRRLKRIIVFMIEELRRAKSFGRVLVILRYSLSGIRFYLKLRKADFRQ